LVDSVKRIDAKTGPDDAVLPGAAGERFLGVLMLDTRFPRWPGDIGHPISFGCPVRHAVVAGAVPGRVVAPASAALATELLFGFAEQAQGLVAQGVFAITTSCGFLVLVQDALQSMVTVPVVTSSLLQLPALLAQHRRVGVLTISAGSLGEAHLRAAGVPGDRLADVVVQGVAPDGPFAGPILQDEPRRDFEAAQADVVHAALALRGRAPDVAVAVLECTNMPPHAQAAARVSGLRLLSLLHDERLRPP
jgi:hypothetical protein